MSGVKTLKVAYADIGNMGDQLNPLIISKCFGYVVESTSREQADVCGIGSHLLSATKKKSKETPLYVWGTGFVRYDATPVEVNPSVKYCAVRGELSKNKVEKLLGTTLDIPTGDAGLLAPYLFDGMIAKKYKLGVVAHFREREETCFRELLELDKSSVLIDVTDDPLEVVRMIASCEVVLSSSLHGLIVSDAFGIPNLHVKVTDKMRGDGFKYDDYYSSYGVEHKFIDLNKDAVPNLEFVRCNYTITRGMVSEKQSALLSAFPYPRIGQVKAQLSTGSVMLSVILPCYNVRKFIRRSLDSVLAALCRLNASSEVICVDDGSTDGTSNIIAEFQNRFEAFGVHFVSLRHNNAGAGAARNIGLDIAKGKYLHFCDPDDFVEPEIYSQLVPGMEKRGADVAVCGWRVISYQNDLDSAIFGLIGSARKLLSDGIDFVEPRTLSNDLFSMATVDPWNKLFRHSFIREKSLRFQEIRRANDVYFVCMALAQAKSIFLTDRSLYNYRQNGESVRRNDSLAASFCDAFSLVKHDLLDRHIFGCLSSAFVRVVIECFRDNFMTMTSDVAMEHLYPRMRAGVLDMVPPETLSVDGHVSEELRVVYDMLSNSSTPLPLAMHFMRALNYSQRQLCSARLAVAAKNAELEQLRGAIARLGETGMV